MPTPQMTKDYDAAVAAIEKAQRMKNASPLIVDPDTFVTIGNDSWDWERKCPGDLDALTEPDRVDKVDMVNEPPHYTSHPSGVECIQIAEHMGFCLGNALKYIWRAGLKDDAIEDLRKAEFYLKREIERRSNTHAA